MDFMKQHRKFILELQNTLRSDQSALSRIPEKSLPSHTMRQKTYPSLINSLNIKKMKNVLEFSKEGESIVVEPGMTMEELVDQTLPHGLIPPVVPEFKGITVGGAINGAALESSSHIFGQFNDICLSYEVLLANGDVLTASPEENKELFYAFSGSYGTLGCLLSVKIRLIPQSPWIKLQFKEFSNPADSLDYLDHLHQTEKPAVMEAIVYPKKTMVIYGSPLSHDQAVTIPKITFSKFYDPWFYSYVETCAKDDVVVPLKDYIFRHDRGGFWMAGYGFHPLMIFRYMAHKVGNFFGLSETPKWLEPKFCLPKNPSFLSRLLFGGLTGSGNLYKSLHKKSEDWFQKYFVIQDFYLPKESSKQFIAHILDHYKITPLWICPIQATSKEQLFSPHMLSHEKLIFDIGVYGIPGNHFAKEVVQDLEHLTYELKGRKMFYCSSFLTPEQFWKIYQKQEPVYLALRKKYAAQYMPDITQKVLH